MNKALSPVLLDISRTISRAGIPIPTGIDRVELAYIDHYLHSDRPVWFLSRIAGGFAVLDPSAMHMIVPMISGETPWQDRDLIARLFSQKKPLALQKAESTLRRLAFKWCATKKLTSLLNALPAGFSYINVGHANRKMALWQAMKDSHAGRCIAMVHDVIPLDYPEFTRPDTVSKFSEELQNTAKNCDYLIYNSADTANRTTIWLNNWQIDCKSVIALLGISTIPEPQSPKPAKIPYFVTLGTIEPRKNHKLLLDIWQEFFAQGDHDVQLHIIGRRGWMNEDVFRVLDTHAMTGKTVFEHKNMDDSGAATLMSGARALLFPSFAEGFGYPLVEALQQEIPTICSNLACFQELSAHGPLYLDPGDKQAWKNAILEQKDRVREEKAERRVEFPTWDEHFLKIDTII